MTSAVLAIAQRDVTKLFRDRARLITDLTFPLSMAMLGGLLGLTIGGALGFNFFVYVLTGAYAQSMFQSAAMGMIFLIEDRENDFSQEIFVSPIPRLAIVFGKILGESLVALPQGLAILVLMFVLTTPPTLAQLAGLAWVTAVVCLLGGSFGLLILGGLSRRAANQVFGFIMLPQIFLAGVFNPLQNLPPWLDVISHLAPMRYAVDLTRAVYYAGQPDEPRVVLDGAPTDLAVCAALVALFVAIGTTLFVRAERNR